MRRCCFLGGSCSSESLLAPTTSCFEPVVVVVAALMCRRLRSMTFLSPLVALVLLMLVVAVVALAVGPFLEFNYI